MKKNLPCGRPLSQKMRSPLSNALKEILREKLRSHITKAGLNQSESRNQIFEILLSETGHFSVGELLRTVQEKVAQVGAATLYRNIPVFVEAGILRETFTDDQGQRVYEISNEEHHDHIVCLDCNQILEFHDAKIEAAQDSVAQQMKFQLLHHKHVIYAHCGYIGK